MSDLPLKNIALILDEKHSWCREMVPGIARYARENGEWYLQIHTLRDLHKHACDGIIGVLYDEDPILAEMRQTPTCPPLVNVSGANPPKGIPLVTHDNPAIGRLAAEHLMSLGLKRFACATISSVLHSRERFAGFTQALLESGKPEPEAIEEGRGESMVPRMNRLIGPVGVFAIADIRARHVEQAARKAGRTIPGEIALIGCDNDLMECELCATPVSSVALNFELVGYTAAAALDRMMHGEEVAMESRIAPLQVVQRRSSDYLLVDDSMVRRVLNQIRQNYREPLTTAELAKKQGLTPRHLQRRFRAATGNTVQGELQRIRLEKARDLLRDTPLSIAEIAMETGFSDINRFPQYFRRQYGSTPRDFRAGLTAKR